MALYAAAAAGTGLMAMYASAKTQLPEDLRVLNATRTFTKGMEKSEKAGKLSLFSVLEHNARTRPSSPSIHYVPTNTEETWLSTYTTVLQIATLLHREHVRPGEVVAVNYTNKPTMLHIWLALSALGAAPAFINYNLSGERLLHCLRASGATLLLLDDEVSDKVQASREAIEDMGIRTLLFDDAYLEEISKLVPWSPTFDVSSNTPTTLSCIFYTSGTTGFPKPAAFPMWRWYAVGLMMAQYLRFGPEDRFYSNMPLYHGSASSCFMIAMFQGGCFCIGHKFSVTRFWDEVRQSRATAISYVGETFRFLLTAPPSARERDHFVHSAYGNGLRPDVWHKVRERFGVANIVEFYGASEGVGSTLNYNSGLYGLGAVGRGGLLQRFLKRNDLVAIKVDPDTLQPERTSAGLCIKVKTDEPGELLMRIPYREFFRGYYRDEKATEEKILRDVMKHGDMWFRSGDLLRQDSDGFWFFVDRLGETFRWRSENVSTMEVQGALAQYPNVADIVVYGVQLPRHEGRAGCAAIVPSSSADFDFARFFNFAKESLPKYAVPIFIRITNQIAKLENNKHVKAPLMKEGVDPKKVATDDTIYWLKDGVTGKEGYTRFTEGDWLDLESGAVSL